MLFRVAQHLTGFRPSVYRLEEFVKTPASALTQGEFESEELDDLQSENPPAYQRAETTRKEDAIVLMIENGRISAACNILGSSVDMAT